MCAGSRSGLHSSNCLTSHNYYPPSYLQPSRLQISPLINDSFMRMQHNVEMG
jgi:hypothetical protein